MNKERKSFRGEELPDINPAKINALRAKYGEPDDAQKAYLRAGMKHSDFSEKQIDEIGPFGALAIAEEAGLTPEKFALQSSKKSPETKPFSTRERPRILKGNDVYELTQNYGILQQRNLNLFAILAKEGKYTEEEIKLMTPVERFTLAADKGWIAPLKGKKSMAELRAARPAPKSPRKIKTKGGSSNRELEDLEDESHRPDDKDGDTHKLDAARSQAEAKMTCMSRKQYKAFVKTGQVPEEVLNNIAQKMMEGKQVMSPEEQAVYVVHGTKIEEILQASRVPKKEKAPLDQLPVEPTHLDSRAEKQWHLEQAVKAVKAREEMARGASAKLLQNLKDKYSFKSRPHMEFEESTQNPETDVEIEQTEAWKTYEKYQVARDAFFALQATRAEGGFFARKIGELGDVLGKDFSEVEKAKEVYMAASKDMMNEAEALVKTRLRTKNEANDQYLAGSYQRYIEKFEKKWGKEESQPAFLKEEPMSYEEFKRDYEERVVKRHRGLVANRYLIRDAAIVENEKLGVIYAEKRRERGERAGNVTSKVRFMEKNKKTGVVEEKFREKTFFEASKEAIKQRSILGAMGWYKNQPAWKKFLVGSAIAMPITATIAVAGVLSSPAGATIGGGALLTLLSHRLFVSGGSRAFAVGTAGMLAKPLGFLGKKVMGLGEGKIRENATDKLRGEKDTGRGAIGNELRDDFDTKALRKKQEEYIALLNAERTAAGAGMLTAGVVVGATAVVGGYELAKHAWAPLMEHGWTMGAHGVHGAEHLIDNAKHYVENIGHSDPKSVLSMTPPAGNNTLPQQLGATPGNGVNNAPAVAGGTTQPQGAPGQVFGTPDQAHPSGATATVIGESAGNMMTYHGPQDFPALLMALRDHQLVVPKLTPEQILPGHAYINMKYSHIFIPTQNSPEGIATAIKNGFKIAHETGQDVGIPLADGKTYYVTGPDDVLRETAMPKGLDTSVWLAPSTDLVEVPHAGDHFDLIKHPVTAPAPTAETVAPTGEPDADMPNDTRGDMGGSQMEFRGVRGVTDMGPGTEPTNTPVPAPEASASQLPQGGSPAGVTEAPLQTAPVVPQTPPAVASGVGVPAVATIAQGASRSSLDLDALTRQMENTSGKVISSQPLDLQGGLERSLHNDLEGSYARRPFTLDRSGISGESDYLAPLNTHTVTPISESWNETNRVEVDSIQRPEGTTPANIVDAGTLKHMVHGFDYGKSVALTTEGKEALFPRNFGSNGIPSFKPEELRGLSFFSPKYDPDHVYFVTQSNTDDAVKDVFLNRFSSQSDLSRILVAHKEVFTYVDPETHQNVYVTRIPKYGGIVLEGEDIDNSILSAPETQPNPVPESTFKTPSSSPLIAPEPNEAGPTAHSHTPTPSSQESLAKEALESMKESERLEQERQLNDLLFDDQKEQLAAKHVAETLTNFNGSPEDIKHLLGTIEYNRNLLPMEARGYIATIFGNTFDKEIVGRIISITQQPGRVAPDPSIHNLFIHAGKDVQPQVALMDDGRLMVLGVTKRNATEAFALAGKAAGMTGKQVILPPYEHTPLYDHQQQVITPDGGVPMVNMEPLGDTHAVAILRLENMTDHPLTAPVTPPAPAHIESPDPLNVPIIKSVFGATAGKAEGMAKLFQLLKEDIGLNKPSSQALTDVEKHILNTDPKTLAHEYHMDKVRAPKGSVLSYDEQSGKLTYTLKGGSVQELHQTAPVQEPVAPKAKVPEQAPTQKPAAPAPKTEVAPTPKTAPEPAPVKAEVTPVVEPTLKADIDHPHVYDDAQGRHFVIGPSQDRSRLINEYLATFKLANPPVAPPTYIEVGPDGKQLIENVPVIDKNGFTGQFNMRTLQGETFNPALLTKTVFTPPPEIIPIDSARAVEDSIPSGSDNAVEHHRVGGVVDQPTPKEVPVTPKPKVSAPIPVETAVTDTAGSGDRINQFKGFDLEADNRARQAVEALQTNSGANAFNTATVEALDRYGHSAIPPTPHMENGMPTFDPTQWAKMKSWSDGKYIYTVAEGRSSDLQTALDKARLDATGEVTKVIGNNYQFEATSGTPDGAQIELDSKYIQEGGRYIARSLVRTPIDGILPTGK